MSDKLPAAPSPDQRAALATILRLLPQLTAAQQRDLQAKPRALRSSHWETRAHRRKELDRLIKPRRPDAGNKGENDAPKL